MIESGVSPMTAIRAVNSFRRGDVKPMQEALQPGLQSPPPETSLEPNPAAPHVRYAARSLSSRGNFEVPASWVEANIAIDPQSLARSPTYSEIMRWEAWQRDHPGQ